MWVRARGLCPTRFKDRHFGRGEGRGTEAELCSTHTEATLEPHIYFFYLKAGRPRALQISIKNFLKELTPNFPTSPGGTPQTCTRILRMQTPMRMGCIGRRRSLVALDTSPSGLSFSRKRTPASCVSDVVDKVNWFHSAEIKPTCASQKGRATILWG